MAGSATLNPEVLVDGLVPVIDSLRGELHPAFGVRAYRGFCVKRSWSGRIQGEGTLTDTTTELLPQPRVEVWSGLRYELAAAGLSEMGQIRLSEISLTYTMAELSGGALTPTQQFFYRLEDAHGQGSPARYFQETQPPFVDREKDMGWVVFLRSIELPGKAGGAP
jgi:hypothetical protein